MDYILYFFRFIFTRAPKTPHSSVKTDLSSDPYTQNDSDKKETAEFTPLMHALYVSDIKTIIRNLSGAVHINHQFKYDNHHLNGYTALSLACLDLNVDILDLILKHDPDPTLRSNGEQTALMITVIEYGIKNENNFDFLVKLLEYKTQQHIDLLDNNHNSALLYAIPNPPVFKIILSKHPSLSYTDNRYRSVLIIVIREGNVETLGILCKYIKENHGVDNLVDMQDEDGKTALIHVADCHTDIRLTQLDLLLSLHPNVTIMDNSKKTALEYGITKDIQNTKDFLLPFFSYIKSKYQDTDIRTYYDIVGKGFRKALYMSNFEIFALLFKEEKNIDKILFSINVYDTMDLNKHLTIERFVAEFVLSVDYHSQTWYCDDIRSFIESSIYLQLRPSHSRDNNSNFKSTSIGPSTVQRIGSSTWEKIQRSLGGVKVDKKKRSDKLKTKKAKKKTKARKK